MRVHVRAYRPFAPASSCCVLSELKRSRFCLSQMTYTTMLIAQEIATQPYTACRIVSSSDGSRRPPNASSARSTRPYDEKKYGPVDTTRKKTKKRASRGRVIDRGAKMLIVTMLPSIM